MDILKKREMHSTEILNNLVFLLAEVTNIKNNLEYWCVARLLGDIYSYDAVYAFKKIREWSIFGKVRFAIRKMKTENTGSAFYTKEYMVKFGSLSFIKKKS